MDLDRQGLAFVRVMEHRFALDQRCDYSAQPRPFYILACVESGAADLEEDGRVCHIESGETAFIPLHCCYRSHWYGKPDTRVLSCFFLLPEGCAPLGERRFLLQKVTHMQHIQSDVRFIHDHQNDPDRLFEVLSRFYGICAELFAPLAHSPAPRLSPRIRLAAEHIRAHYREPIGIDALAELSGMSESHFYSCFHREVGLSPIAYKHRIAITAAERLLTANDDMSIEEVSGLVGFESSAYFRRVFKTLTGVSPRSYRRQAGRG